MQADCLSRLPVVSVDPENFSNGEGAIALVQDVVSLGEGAFTKEEWCLAMAKDVILAKVMDLVKQGGKRESCVVPSVRPFIKILDELSVSGDNVLTRGDRYMPPMELRPRLINLAHEGHMGQTFTQRRLKTHFWWPAMDADVSSWVENCSPCKEREKRLKLAVGSSTGHIAVPNQPWHSVCLDFIGPMEELPVAQRFAIVAVDVYSKWLAVKFVKDTTTDCTIMFLRNLFQDEDYPSVLITDNGTQLLSNKMLSFLSHCGVTHHRTSLYNPQGNAICERANRVIKGILQMFSERGEFALEMVQQMVWANCTTAHTNETKSPFELMRGRRPGTKLVPPWMRENPSWISATHDNQPSHAIAVGDLVKVKPGRVRKGLSKFRGPYKVKNVFSHYIVLENNERWNLRRVALYQKYKSSETPSCHQADAPSNGYMLAMQSESSPQDLLVSRREEGGGDAFHNAFHNTQSVTGGQQVSLPCEARAPILRRPPAYLNDYLC